jgi:hypothetical protein
MAKKQSEPRRHHLVPRWYLERFATNSGIVAVVDREQGRRYKSSVTKISTEIGYYDVDVPGQPRDLIESQLLAPLEGHAKKGVIRLVQVGPTAISDAERWNIATFVAAQILRGKDQESIADQMADMLLKAQLAGMSDERIRELSPSPMTDEDLEHIRDPDAFKVRIPGAVIQGLVTHLEGFTRILFHGYDWAVVRYAEPCVFTSDVPVVMARDRGEGDFYGVGIGSADTIEMPLDPHTILRLHTNVLPGSGRPEEIIDGSLSDLQPLLERLVNGAHRWVFAHQQNPLYDKWIPILPPHGPRLSGGENLVEIATKMRLFHEAQKDPSTE